MTKAVPNSKMFTIAPDGSIKTDVLMLTIDQLARAMGYKPSSLRNLMTDTQDWVLDDRLKVVRYGRNVRFRMVDLVAVVRDPTNTG